MAVLELGAKPLLEKENDAASPQNNQGKESPPDVLHTLHHPAQFLLDFWSFVRHALRGATPVSPPRSSDGPNEDDHLHDC